MMVGRVIAPTQRSSQLLQQLNQLKISLESFIDAALKFSGGDGTRKTALNTIQSTFDSILQLDRFKTAKDGEKTADYIRYFKRGLEMAYEAPFVLTGWAVVSNLNLLLAEQSASVSRSLIDEWLLGEELLSVFHKAGINESLAGKSISLIKILTLFKDWLKET